MRHDPLSGHPQVSLSLFLPKVKMVERNSGKEKGGPIKSYACIRQNVNTNVLHASLSACTISSFMSLSLVEAVSAKRRSPFTSCFDVTQSIFVYPRKNISLIQQSRTDLYLKETAGNVTSIVLLKFL